MSAKLALRVIQIKAEYYIYLIACWVALSALPSIIAFRVFDASPLPIFIAIIISLVGLFELPIKNLERFGEGERELSFPIKPFYVGFAVWVCLLLTDSLTIQILVGVLGLWGGFECICKASKNRYFMEFSIISIGALLAVPTLFSSTALALSFLINLRKIDAISDDEKRKLYAYIQTRL